MDDHALVLRAEEQRRAALVAVDLPALSALFAEDLVHIHSTGMTHDKAALLRHIEERRAFRAIDRGPLHVRIHGDIAIMTGAMTNHMVMDGRSLAMTGMVTQVLRKEAGAWRFINFQLTTD